MIQNHIFGVNLLISDFLAERLKANKNGHPFYNTILLKKPYSFYKPQLNQHCKKYIPATKPKTLLTLQIFQQTCFWLVPVKTFALYHF